MRYRTCIHNLKPRVSARSLSSIWKENLLPAFPRSTLAPRDSSRGISPLAPPLRNWTITTRRPAASPPVTVGFVNVVESKERAFEACGRYGVPCIAAMGRKGP